MKKAIKTGVLLSLMLSCLLAPAIVTADDSAVVFMYHRFGEDRFPSTSIKAAQLQQQLELLSEDGFNVIPLERLLSYLQDGTDLPPKAVVLTVDDAYQSVYSTGWPLFQKYDFPFTVFVSTGPVDKNFAGYMSWDEMREMADAGVTFANHGAEHLYLVRREGNETLDEWKKRIHEDAIKGRERLGEELGSLDALVQTAFAYPYGEYSEPVAQIISSLGYTAFGQQSGAVGEHSDRRALPRFPMAEAFADIGEFRTKANSLAMPVESISPWDPVTGRDPSLVITLAEAPERISELSCFVSNQGKVSHQWDAANRSIIVAPSQWLGRGRSRVNCTLPGPSGRFYWFSHQWIVQ